MSDLSAASGALPKELYSADVFRVTTINKDSERNSQKFGGLLKDEDDAAQDESHKKDTPHKSEAEVPEPEPDHLNISESARKASAAVIQVTSDIKKENAADAPSDPAQPAGIGGTINIMA